MDWIVAFTLFRVQPYFFLRSHSLTHTPSVCLSFVRWAQPANVKMLCWIYLDKEKKSCVVDNSIWICGHCTLASREFWPIKFFWVTFYGFSNIFEEKKNSHKKSTKFNENCTFTAMHVVVDFTMEPWHRGNTGSYVLPFDNDRLRWQYSLLYTFVWLWSAWFDIRRGLHSRAVQLSSIEFSWTKC